MYPVPLSLSFSICSLFVFHQQDTMSSSDSSVPRYIGLFEASQTSSTFIRLNPFKRAQCAAAAPASSGSSGTSISLSLHPFWQHFFAY